MELLSYLEDRPAWSYVAAVARLLTFPCYPVGFLVMSTIHWAPTVENARFFIRFQALLWLLLDLSVYNSIRWFFRSATRSIFCLLWFLMFDMANIMIMTGAFLACGLLQRRVFKNRLVNPVASPVFKGPRIVVLGNGPSLAQGEPLGKVVDGMDEVVRFNNFQTKASGLEKWTGIKTTVHFSDGMLFPSYKQYHVPGACVVLSLCMDRLVVTGSYFLFRMFGDAAVASCFRLFNDASLGWIFHEDIQVLKKALKLSLWKHPTSGVLAIDWFVRNRPDMSVPIYIHGFDFFEGNEVHYYDKTEPLYERIIDLLGVNCMHEPWKERAFVERLVAEGHVKWLRDAM